MTYMGQRMTAVLTAHGGLGDFLFQLDLAKRLEEEHIPAIVLVRARLPLLSDILRESDVTQARLMRADGVHYAIAICRVWMLALTRTVVIINPIKFSRLRAPTIMFYRVALFLSARVIMCNEKLIPDVPYEQLTYRDNETIWQRNNRIVEYLSPAMREKGFPLLSFRVGDSPINEPYVYIHPVSSSLQKSYPARNLISALTLLEDYRIVLTLSPAEESWYMTDALRSYIDSHANITYIPRQLSIAEAIAYIAHSRVFCTVNTGLLWMALMLKHAVVVCDTHTDLEWNPTPYARVIRLQHDYDEHGNSLHLVLATHDDGTYYESMYRISGLELGNAVVAAYTAS